MKHPKIDPGILQAALVGFELQRNRIEDAIASLRAELEDLRPGRSTPKPATTAPAVPRKRRFSAAARRRMALAQKERWAALKAKKAQARKAKPAASAKRRKGNVATATKVTPVRVAKKVAPKPKAAKAVSKPKPTKKIVANPTTIIETPAPQVQATPELAPANA